MSTSCLYFIALVPHEDLRKRVAHLKREMHARFKAAHALKSPAHITLQTPFRWIEQNEDELCNVLTNFSMDQMSFRVDLNRFGRFSPRVIYIKIAEHGPIVHLHNALRTVLIEELRFDPTKMSGRYNPHITIATRDLTEEYFQKAWPEFRKRDFHDCFNVKSLFLLKHNGKNWDIFREFPFGTS